MPIIRANLARINTLTRRAKSSSVNPLMSGVWRSCLNDSFHSIVLNPSSLMVQGRGRQGHMSFETRWGSFFGFAASFPFL